MRRFVLAILLFSPALTLCQATSPAAPKPSAKAAPSQQEPAKAAAKPEPPKPDAPKEEIGPACPKGQACESFRQLWKANDPQVKAASWACFPQVLRGVPLLPTSDEFFILTIDPKSAELAFFKEGITRLTRKAAAPAPPSPAPVATPAPPSSPAEAAGTSAVSFGFNETNGTRESFTIEVGPTELTVRQRDPDKNGRRLVQLTTIRISTGRYSQESLLNGTTRHTAAGQCLQLKK